MTLAQQLRGPRILHLALLSTIAIYVVIAFVASVHPTPTKPGAPDVTLPFTIALAVAGVIEQLVIAVIRRKRLGTGDLGDAAVDLDREPTRPEREALNVYRQVSILTWALCESCAIFGLVLAFITGEPWRVLPFAAVGAGSLLFYAPSRADIEAVVRRAARG